MNKYSKTLYSRDRSRCKATGKNIQILVVGKNFLDIKKYATYYYVKLMWKNIQIFAVGNKFLDVKKYATFQM